MEKHVNEKAFQLSFCILKHFLVLSAFLLNCDPLGFNMSFCSMLSEADQEVCVEVPHHPGVVLYSVSMSLSNLNPVELSDNLTIPSSPHFRTVYNWTH